ncbi:hypothetical protein Bbelb_169320 [Branchiostoma belcheri]|nr:hypothetical protein Bbelb_169320 [Branchiostoma belcheri]
MRIGQNQDPFLSLLLTPRAAEKEGRRPGVLSAKSTASSVSGRAGETGGKVHGTVSPSPLSFALEEIRLSVYPCRLFVRKIVLRVRWNHRQIPARLKLGRSGRESKIRQREVAELALRCGHALMAGRFVIPPFALGANSSTSYTARPANDRPYSYKLL